MSLRATLWVLDLAPVDNPTAVLVLIGLADEANDDGTDAGPYIDKLKHRARVSERSVQNYLRELYRMRLIDFGDQAVALRRYNKRPGHAPRVWNLNLAATWDNIPTPRTDEEMQAYSTAYARRAKQGKGNAKRGVQNPHPEEVQDLHPADEQGVSTSEVQDLHPGGVQPTAPQPEGEVQSATENSAASCTPEVKPVAPSPNDSQDHPSFGNSLPSVESYRDSAGTEQPTLDGKIPPPASPKEPTAHDRAMGIARDWETHRRNLDPPQPIAGGNVLHTLKSLIKPFLVAGFTDVEVKYGLLDLDEGIPSRRQLERALNARRKGQPIRSNGQQQRRENLHIDDISDKERAGRNPFAKATRSSDVVGATGANR